MADICTAAGVQTDTYDCKHAVDETPDYVRILRYIARMTDVAATR